MGVIISFGIQKGGVGKSTTTGISSYLLSKEYKVLAVDFDSQGNLTQFLIQKNIYDFTHKTVLEALKEKNPTPYIYKITEPNLQLTTREIETISTDFCKSKIEWIDSKGIKAVNRWLIWMCWHEGILKKDE